MVQLLQQHSHEGWLRPPQDEHLHHPHLVFQGGGQQQRARDIRQLNLRAFCTCTVGRDPKAVTHVISRFLEECGNLNLTCLAHVLHAACIRQDPDGLCWSASQTRTTLRCVSRVISKTMPSLAGVAAGLH